MFSLILILVTALLVLAFMAARQPDDFYFARQIFINAPAERIFPYLNSPKEADKWMPWKDQDQNVKNTFEGPEAGVGAKVGWSGNNKIGEGSSEIVESLPNRYVKVRLIFKRPMQATNHAEYMLVEKDSGTLMVWSMSGVNTKFAMKFFGTMMNCDGMLKQQFDKGLATLKSMTERG